jgi:hypothetical protein
MRVFRCVHLEGLGIALLVSALEVTILLHVGAVMLQDDDRVVRNVDGLQVRHLLQSPILRAVSGACLSPSLPLSLSLALSPCLFLLSLSLFRSLSLSFSLSLSLSLSISLSLFL